MTTQHRASTFPSDNRKLAWLHPRGLIAGVFVLAAVAAGLGAVYYFNRTAADEASAAPAPAAQVQISRSGLVPETVTIQAGQAVNWTNTDVEGHVLGLVNTGTGVSAPGFGGNTPVNPNESYSYTFSAPGTYSYTDDANPGHIRGFVIVR